jgi:carnosine N-methyltransferase
MLIPSNFILNRTSRIGEHVIFPFLHNTCNAISEEDVFTTAEIPDVLPSDLPAGADFSYAAGDFVEIYSSQPGTLFEAFQTLALHPKSDLSIFPSRNYV